MLEPRYYQRANVDLACEISTSASPKRSGRIVNLSESGALVAFGDGFAPPEGPVRLRFSLDDLPTPLELEAAAVRISKQDASTSVAFAFTPIDDAAATAIRAMVERVNGMAWDGASSRIPREVAVRFVPLIRRLARSLAQRLPPQVAIDDLIGAGFVALVELYAKHPNAPLPDLERIAVPRLRWAMLDELRNADPLSRRMRQRARKISRVSRAMQHELGRRPAHTEIAERMGISMESYAAAMRLAHSSDAISLDHVEEVDVPDREASGPEHAMQQTESFARLKTALDALPPRLQKILQLYYGDDLTLRQIGNILGVTEARISQLLSEAVDRMRERCSTDTSPPPPVRKKRGGKGVAKAAA